MCATVYGVRKDMLSMCTGAKVKSQNSEAIKPQIVFIFLFFYFNEWKSQFIDLFRSEGVLERNSPPFQCELQLCISVIMCLCFFYVVVVLLFVVCSKILVTYNNCLIHNCTNQTKSRKSIKMKKDLLWTTVCAQFLLGAFLRWTNSVGHNFWQHTWVLIKLLNNLTKIHVFKQ